MRLQKSLFSLLLLLILGLSLSGSQCPARDTVDYADQQKAMVENQIQARGVNDPLVLKAMETVPRHLFVPEAYRVHAYNDSPLPIGEGQTISQPYIVAYMTEVVQPKPTHRVLEIGTGSGYQAAILAQLVQEVYTIEIIESLGRRAEQTLKDLGYDNVHVRIGDGHKGWPEAAPFDAVIVTCAPEKIPEPLVQQLKEGGRIIVPVGPVGAVQHLVLGIKKGDRLEQKDVMPVRFVPMVEEPRP